MRARTAVGQDGAALPVLTFIENVRYFIYLFVTFYH